MSDDDNTGADADVLTMVAAWLAALPAFQRYTGTDSAEAAAARVLSLDGPILTDAHVLIDVPVLRFTRTGGGGFDGTADVPLAFAAPPLLGETYAAAELRTLRHVAAIRRGLIEVIGQRLIGIAGDPPTTLDPSDGLPLWVEWSLSLTLEVAP